jgi:integrase
MASVALVYRNDKLNKHNKAPIHFRIIKNRKIKYISSGVMLEVKYWDKKRNQVKPTHPNSNRLNSFLSNKYAEIQDQVLEFETTSRDLSSTQIRDKVIGKKPTSFLQFAEEVLQDYLNNDQIGTHDKNKAILNKLKEYLKKRTLDFSDITPRFLTEYERYLKTVKGNSIGTIQNSMKFIRKCFNEAIRQDLIPIQSNPFLKFKIKSDKPQRTYLTEEELTRIVEVKLPTDSKTDLYRDMFVFSAYVGGLRISDVLQLQRVDFDGTYIHIGIHKTKRQLSIKVPNKALEIINKYESVSKRFIFPVIAEDFNLDDPLALDRRISASTASINKTLKKIAARAGVEKNISFHISRHTWATRALRKGISIDKVAKLLGHANIRETQIYAKIVGEELDKAMDLFND